MKQIYLLIILGIWITCASSVKVPVLIYLNPDYSINTRVNDLISRMTLPEKVSQMSNSSPAIPRLNIAAYNWWSEALHGVARSGTATVFPQAIGLAATFDDSLVDQIGTAISDEARAMYNAATKEDYHLQYGGLTFWSPNINIFRDPRWGRGQETYGEDPFLTSLMGSAFVRGMQGDNPRYLKVAACAKHFAVHSGPERLRHVFDAEVSLHDLYDTYLPAFHALVKQGVAGVMCAYSSVNGEPCCANTFLLDDVLRKDWGFKGYIVSDCDAVADIYQGHKYTKDAVSAAAIALKRGVNLDCGNSYGNLIDAEHNGLITENELDSSLAILLRIRFRVGMFDPAGMNPYNRIPASVINSPAHRELASRAAEESIVMLKNDGALPLKTNLSKYYLTGPNATSIDVLLGNYYGVNNRMVTVLEGLASDISTGSQLQYKPGFLLDRKNVNPIDWTTGDAKASDVTIVVLGLSGELEGEEGEAIASPSFGDRLDYNLPPNQIDFLKNLRRHNSKPIITVVMGGSPMNLSEVDSLSDAVLLAWYPGEEGGQAVADEIFGKLSPSGKLPVTFPKSLDQLPPFQDYQMKGRTYRYMSAEPFYPFGFGLSYGHFEYSQMSLSANTIHEGQSLNAEATLTNSGKYAATEVAQLYITDESGNPDAPLFALKGFKRIHLRPGQSQKVRFIISPGMLSIINDQGESEIERGKYKIYLAGSVPTARSEYLGISSPATAELTIQ